MWLKMWQFGVVLAFTLGCFLPCVSASLMDISSGIYYGDVGHATSYNYPLKHSYDASDTYTYRLFPDSSNDNTLCVTVRRFDIGAGSRLTIFAPTENHTTQNFEYTGHGERVNLLDDTTLPLNIWSQFCVDLHDDEPLEMTFSPNNTNAVPGFHMEYSSKWEWDPPQDEQELAVNVSSAPCGPGLFTCYNRECVNASSVCTNETACTDLSHNTFAHAFCKDKENGAPIQQAGFWATDFDAGLHGVDVDSGWVLASKVEPPLAGPSSDHTHYENKAAAGKFVHTVIPPTNRTAKMTLEQTSLVAKENCLSFWYYMDGVDPGQLTVELDSTKVWERSGSYGAKWFQAQVNLFCQSPPCRDKVALTAGKGSNPDTRISVDDVSLLPGVCPFTDGDLTEKGWERMSYYCKVPKYGQMVCRNVILVNLPTSSRISRGKCLVGNVIFSEYLPMNDPDTLTVTQRPLYGAALQLKHIKQRWASDDVLFKIPVETSVASKMELRTYSSAQLGSITFENVHVVDNACEEITIGCYDEFMCKEHHCIPESSLCSGIPLCDAGQDEENCTECKRDAFLCDNHRCIQSKLVCNGADDCGDNSEEHDCPAAAGSTTGSVITMAIGVVVAVYGNPFYPG